MLGRVCWKGSGSIAHLAGLTAGVVIGVALGVKGVKPVHCIVHWYAKTSVVEVIFVRVSVLGLTGACLLHGLRLTYSLLCVLSAAVLCACLQLFVTGDDSAEFPELPGYTSTFTAAVQFRYSFRTAQQQYSRSVVVAGTAVVQWLNK